MAKAKTSPYGLKAGHPMEFRRTIKGKKPYQLVFQPGTPLELTEAEVAGLKRELECGLIVPWEPTDLDHRGRPRPLRKDEQPTVAEAGADDNDTDENEIIDDDMPLGDESLETLVGAAVKR